jgi:hypothetical protein
MAFVTYENRANPHVTVHSENCRQIRKNGGNDKHGHGKYKNHATLSDADAYARTTDLPVRHCAFCVGKPKR